MDAERSERKPAGAGLPSSVRKVRGINADAPQVKTISFDEDVNMLGSSAGEEASVRAELDGGGGVGRQAAGGLRGWTQGRGDVPSAAAQCGEIQERPL